MRLSKRRSSNLASRRNRSSCWRSDVPADARVTIVAKNIRLSTALDMLTDATELKWGRQTVKKSGRLKRTASLTISAKMWPNLTLQWSSAQFSPNNYDLLPETLRTKNSRSHYPELFNKDGSPQKYNVTPPICNGLRNSNLGMTYNDSEILDRHFEGRNDFCEANRPTSPPRSPILWATHCFAPTFDRGTLHLYLSAL